MSSIALPHQSSDQTLIQKLSYCIAEYWHKTSFQFNVWHMQRICMFFATQFRPSKYWQFMSRSWQVLKTSCPSLIPWYPARPEKACVPSDASIISHLYWRAQALGGAMHKLAVDLAVSETCTACLPATNRPWPLEPACIHNQTQSLWTYTGTDHVEFYVSLGPT